MFKKHTTYIAIFALLITSILLLVNYILITQFKPTYVRAEYWIPEILKKKTSLSESMSSPKIIIASGSNTLFGINSGVLKKETQSDVLNLGIHAGLPIEFIIYTIKLHANPGDTVVMPLEYEHFSREESPSEWENDLFTTWGRDYMGSFSTAKKIIIYLKSTKNMGRRISNITKELPIRDLSKLQLLPPNQLITSTPYLAEHSNIFGEFYMDEAPTSSLIEKSKNGITYPYKKQISEHFISQVSSAREYLSKNNIRLLITHPTSIKNEKFDTRDPNVISTINNIYTTLEKNNIKTFGNPHKYNMPLLNFYDSSYHLNAFGCTLRTLFLADDLKNLSTKIADMQPPSEEYLSARKSDALRILNGYRNSNAESTPFQ